MENKRGTAFPLLGLGRLAITTGDIRSAAQFLGDALAIRWELGDRKGSAEVIEALAEVAARIDRASTGTRLPAAAEVLRAQLGSLQPPTFAAQHERTRTTFRTLLGQASYARSWSAGEAMALDTAVETATTIANIAAAAAETEPTGPAEDPGATPTLTLTPREQQVVALIAQGLSDREIAEALSVSSHTASVHVGTILAKLDVASRVEAVAVALRQGLL